MTSETFPKLADLEVGDKLKADDGFTCLRKGAVRTVRMRNGEPLFIRCDDGDHFLHGQLNAVGEVLGLRLLSPAYRATGRKA